MTGWRRPPCHLRLALIQPAAPPQPRPAASACTALRVGALAPSASGRLRAPPFSSPFAPPPRHTAAPRGATGRHGGAGRAEAGSEWPTGATPLAANYGDPYASPARPAGIRAGQHDARPAPPRRTTPRCACQGTKSALWAARPGEAREGNKDRTLYARWRRGVRSRRGGQNGRREDAVRCPAFQRPSPSTPRHGPGPSPSLPAIKCG